MGLQLWRSLRGAESISAGPGVQSKTLELATKIGDQDKSQMHCLPFIGSIKQQRFDLAKQYSQETFDLAHNRGDRSMELYSLLEKGQVPLGNGAIRKLSQFLSKL